MKAGKVSRFVVLSFLAAFLSAFVMAGVGLAADSLRKGDYVWLYVKGQNVNLRDAPGTQSRVLRRANEGNYLLEALAAPVNAGGSKWYRCYIGWKRERSDRAFSADLPKDYGAADFYISSDFVRVVQMDDADWEQRNQAGTFTMDAAERYAREAGGGSRPSAYMPPEADARPPAYSQSAPTADRPAAPAPRPSGGRAMSADDFVDLCGSGTLQEIEAAIAAGTDVNSKNDENGRFALDEACKKNRLDVVRLLIKNGADVNSYSYPNAGDTTPLMIALFDGGAGLEIIQLLIENGADVNARDNNDHTPLMYAAMFSNTEMIRFLIKNGADVKIKDENGETALDQFKKNDLYSKLSDSGREDALLPLQYGKAGLYIKYLKYAVIPVGLALAAAVIFGAFALFRKRGTRAAADADVVVTTTDTFITPVTPRVHGKKSLYVKLFACLAACLALAALIFALSGVFGSNGTQKPAATATNNNQASQAQRQSGGNAAGSSRGGAMDFIYLCEDGTLEEIEAAIAGGADVNARGYHGDPALPYAVKKQRLDVVRLLIKNGADVNVINTLDNADFYGETPLMHAAEYANPEMIQLLIKNGADVNAVRRNDGQTPLFYAVFSDKQENIKALIENGADVKIKDDMNRTALDYARARGRGCEETLRLLKYGKTGFYVKYVKIPAYLALAAAVIFGAFALWKRRNRVAEAVITTTETFITPKIQGKINFKSKYVKISACAAVCLVLAALIFAVSGGFESEAKKRENIFAYLAAIVDASVQGPHFKKYNPDTTDIQRVEKEGETWHRFTLKQDSRFKRPLDVLISDKRFAFEYRGYTLDVPQGLFSDVLMNIAAIIDDFDNHY